MSDSYNSDPRSKTVDGFIAGLTLLSRYMEKGLSEKYFMGGEHDIVHIYVSTDDCPEDSEEGRQLVALGFHTADEGWAYFT